jgi:hypothetical protein
MVLRLHRKQQGATTGQPRHDNDIIYNKALVEQSMLFVIQYDAVARAL